MRQGARKRPLGPANLDLREAQGLCKFDPSHAGSAYFDLPTWTRHRASENSTFRTPSCQGVPTWTCQLRPREAQGLCKFDPSHAKASKEAQGLCKLDSSRAKASRSAYFDLPTGPCSILRTPWHQGAPTSTYLLASERRRASEVSPANWKHSCRPMGCRFCLLGNEGCQ